MKSRDPEAVFVAAERRLSLAAAASRMWFAMRMARRDAKIGFEAEVGGMEVEGRSVR